LICGSERWRVRAAGSTAALHRDRTGEAGALLKGSAAADVDLGEHIQQSEALPLAGRLDTLALFGRRDGIVADLAGLRTIPIARRMEGSVLVEGDPAPDFTLESDTGEEVTLSSLRGRPVVLYFYPKDDTTAT
jgi:hypothetical protein